MAPERPALHDWVSAALLTMVGLAAATNVARGTFPDWLRAKFLLDRPPAPAGILIPNLAGVTQPPTGLDPADRKFVTGGAYSDPAPTARLISVWGDCRTGITCFSPCCRKHQGVDLAAPQGTPVYSIGPGTVARAGTGSGGCGGRVAVTQQTGDESIYCHLSAIYVKPGQAIDRAGVPLGAIGTTGNATGTTPHVHFEIHRGGRAVNPAPLIGR